MTFRKGRYRIVESIVSNPKCAHCTRMRTSGRQSTKYKIEAVHSMLRGYESWNAGNTARVGNEMDWPV
jgi:hypothetical protein